MKKELGQVLVLLIVIMTVALATGLSIIQKSISDISTASKAEQSSRAFSAAEAGIEKALEGDAGTPVGPISFDNNAGATVEQQLLPRTVSSGEQQEPLEYPPLAKEDIVQVWLADPDSNVRLPECSAISSSGHSPVCYGQSSLKVYWGTPGITDPANKPAIEIKVIYYDDTSRTYQTQPFYLDSNSTRAASTNGFTDASSDCSFITPVSRTVSTTSGDNGQFACWSTLSGLRQKLMLVRLRLLYSSISQPLAVGAEGTGSNSLLPPQARNIYATGTAGGTQRRIKVFQEEKVVPNYFDYAIFSAGEINKQ